MSLSYPIVVLVIIILATYLIQKSGNSLEQIGGSTWEIDILPNNSLDPSELTIKKGDPVIWYNNTSEPLSIEFIDTPSGIGKPQLNNGGIIYNQENIKHSFQETGQYKYQIDFEGSDTVEGLIKVEK